MLSWMRVSSNMLESAYAHACMSCSTTWKAEGEEGSRHVLQEQQIGEGEQLFGYAANALLSLTMHTGAGLSVYPELPVEAGEPRILGIGLGRLAVIAPCLVTRRWHGPRSAGFVYVTMDGHPERGWEKFEVFLDDQGGVGFRIEARSVPAYGLLTLCRPVQDFAQDAITRLYFRSMWRLVRPSTGRKDQGVS